MRIIATNDYYDLVLTDDDGNMIDTERFERSDDIRDAYVARGVADDDPEEWERKSREECEEMGFTVLFAHEDGTDKWFELENVVSSRG